NRDLYGADFLWIDEAAIARRDFPADAVVVERREWGPLFGAIVAVKEGDRVVAQGPEAGWAALQARLPGAVRGGGEMRRLEKDEIGATNYAQERIRLRLRRLELSGVTGGPEVERLQREAAALQARYAEQAARLAALRAQPLGSAVVAAAGGKEKD